jgi:hypothetical protein
VEGRRYGDACRIDATQDTAKIEGRLGAELRGDRLGARLVGIDHGDKIGARIARVMVGMKAPEIASPYDGGANLVCHGFYRFKPHADGSFAL